MTATATESLPRPLGLSRWPLYYGWVNLGVAALAMVGTLPGRTQGLGLVTEPLLRDLRVDRVAFAEINLVATLVGSLFCLGIGRLVDRVGSRLVLTVLALALGAVVLAMAGVTAMAPLLLLITLTRGLGQSALSVVSLTMVGKWFSRRLSTAMGIYAVVMSLGFMIAFPLVGQAVLSRGWRAAWSGIGVALVFGLAPLAWVFVRRTPEACGLELDGGRDATATAAPDPAAVEEAQGATLGAALRTLRLLGLRALQLGLRPRGLGHRPLQRVDPGRARLRPLDLPPHARDHGLDRARRQLRRRSAGGALVDAAACW